MKKIVFLINNIYGVGGVQRILCEVANGLADTFEVSIVHTEIDSSYGENLYYEYDHRINIIYNEELHLRFSMFQKVVKKINSEFFSIPNAKMLERCYYPDKIKKKLVLFLNQGGYDCVIGVTGTMSLLLSQIKEKLDCACIGWQHNSYAAYFETKGKYCWGQELLAKKYLKQLDACVVLTDKDSNTYKKEFGCVAKRIYNPLTIQCQRKSENNNRLLFCGRLVKQQKGLDYLATILCDVLKKNDKWTAVIVGDGPDKEWIANEMKKHSIEDKVLFVGNQSDVVPYYLDSAILLLTSRWEGFGLVVTEAFEAGIPVVSFKTEGPSEIIQNGVNGVLISNYNLNAFCKKLNELMNDDDLRRIMAQEATCRARDFSQTAIIEQWRILINEVIK